MRNTERKDNIIVFLLENLENYLNHNTSIPCYFYYNTEKKVLTIEEVADEDKIILFFNKISQDYLIDKLLLLLNNKDLLNNFNDFELFRLIF